MITTGPRPVWTSEEDDVLIRRWTEGASAGTIANEIPRRNNNSIVARAHRLELAGRISPITGRRSNKKPKPAFDTLNRVDGRTCFKCGAKAAAKCGHLSEGLGG